MFYGLEFRQYIVMVVKSYKTHIHVFIYLCYVCVCVYIVHAIYIFITINEIVCLPEGANHVVGPLIVVYVYNYARSF